MKTMSVLILFLFCGIVCAQENRLVDMGFRYSVWGVKFELPSEVRWTPIHPNDRQPTKQGISRKATIKSDVLTTLDLTVSLRPPGKVFNHFSFGYALRLVPYGDTEHGYHEGISDYNGYVDPVFLSYTYTKLDRTDVFAHEVSVNLDIPFDDDFYCFLLGCRYLCPFGTKWEQGWDRYAEEEQWRSSQAHLSGFAPYIGVGVGDLEGFRFAFIVSRSRYKMDWDNYKDTSCDSWSMELNLNTRF